MKHTGFVSEQEALGMARDGNIVGLPVTADDINLAYSIQDLRPLPEVHRGEDGLQTYRYELVSPNHRYGW